MPSAGVATNLVTDAWSWGLAAALAVLVLAGTWLAVRAASPSSAATARTRVSQTASGGSAIRRSWLQGHAGATVEEVARNRGKIIDSTIRSDGADVAREADDSLIRDSHIDAQ
jgi:hypothetical protein